MRQYRRDDIGQSEGGACAVTVFLPKGRFVRVEVTKEVMDALDELQREWWRIERREARHVLYLEIMPPSMALADRADGPEALMLRKQEINDLHRALEALSKTEARRLLLYAVEGISVKGVAQIEGCSERAVKYSLAHARRKLHKLLGQADGDQE